MFIASSNKSRVACLDTGVLLGQGIKELNKSRTKQKPTKVLKKIKEDGILKRVCDSFDIRFVNTKQDLNLFMI